MNRVVAAACGLMLTLIAVSSCRLAGWKPKAGASTVAMKDLLPRRVAAGLRLSGEIERYTPDDLWKKIDGAADLFLNYGFRRMVFAGYKRPRAQLPELETSIYCMDSDLNALGVYLAERSEGARRVNVGWEGYRTESGVYFHKGPFYVKIQDLTADVSLGEAARQVARYIDARVPAERERVAEMAVFPPDGLVADSVLYVHRNALGHAFLQRVFQADYEIGGERATLFYCRQDDAARLFGKYRAYGEEFGRIEREWTADGMRLLAIRAFDSSELVFVKGDVFGGVLGCPDRETALRLIRSLLGNIERRLEP